MDPTLNDESSSALFVNAQNSFINKADIADYFRYNSSTYSDERPPEETITLIHNEFPRATTVLTHEYSGYYKPGQLIHIPLDLTTLHSKEIADPEPRQYYNTEKLIPALATATITNPDGTPFDPNTSTYRTDELDTHGLGVTVHYPVVSGSLNSDAPIRMFINLRMAFDQYLALARQSAKGHLRLLTQREQDQIPDSVADKLIVGLLDRYVGAVKKGLEYTPIKRKTHRHDAAPVALKFLTAQAEQASTSQ